MTQSFQQRFASLAERAEQAILQDLTIPPLPEAVLMEAMAYSLSSGGKRFRPVLMLASGELLNLPETLLFPFARALEMIHTYSLIHDDLPAMDNDDLRRGRPTNHKVFGEDMAILAGDALLNRAYEVMFEALASSSDLYRGIRAAGCIARAAGATGMVGGQVLDMLGERVDLTKRLVPADLSHVKEADSTTDAMSDLAQLQRMHALKTGALIRAAVEVPAMLGGTGQQEYAALMIYADQLGLSFQIRDDLLDLQGSEAELGKPVGSDMRNGKRTFVTILGSDGAQEALDEATRRAIGALEPFGERASFLDELARFVATRTH